MAINTNDLDLGAKIAIKSELRKRNGNYCVMFVPGYTINIMMIWTMTTRTNMPRG